MQRPDEQHREREGAETAIHVLLLLRCFVGISGLMADCQSDEIDLSL
jgi:hypothetical protein